MPVEKRGAGGWEELLATDGSPNPGAEWRSTLYEIALAQFEHAADLLELCEHGCASRGAR